MGVILKRALCFELKTAGLIIGYIGAISGVLQMISSIKNINNFDAIYETDYKSFIPEDQKPHLLAAMYVSFALCILNVAISILLILGTKKKSPQLILPWLILNGISLLFIILVTFALFIFAIYVMSAGHGLFMVLAILLIILTGLCLYIFLVIYSLYYHIRDEIRVLPRYDSEAQEYNKVGYNRRS